MPGSLITKMSISEPSRKSSTTSIKSNASQPSPQTYEEFLKVNRLAEWPERITSEGPLVIGENNMGFGNLDDIYNALSSAAPVEYSVFDDLAERLEKIDNLLNKYADTILVRPDAEKPEMSESEEKLFLTETGIEGRQKAIKMKPKAEESIQDIKKRSVDFYSYPGFNKTELNELPSQLETPQILNHITKIRDFDPGFKKYWHKVFLSEASVAVMQDLFWWYFIDRFEPKRTTDQDKLFDRIADSFVALFFGVNPEFRDKFFIQYADCLAQAVFVAFYNGFPESTKRFDDDFIDQLLRICVEWVSGVRPVPEAWKSWDISRLVRPPNENREKRKEIKAPSAASAFHGGLNHHLDMDGFVKVVNQLGTQRGRHAPSTLQVHTANSHHINSKQSVNPGTPRDPNDAKYSHQVGPGPQFETVSFDTLGQSVLVSHFLKQRQLQGELRPQLKVKRTQVSKLPPRRQTYQELIKETTRKSDTLRQQYQDAVVENEAEIHRIQRTNQRTNRDINRIARQVVHVKNPIDIKIMSERVLDMRERERQLAATVTMGDDDASDFSDEDSKRSYDTVLS